jgi:hypothetical protein
LALHSGREADHSPPSSAEVKEWVELYLHSPNAPSWRGAQLEGAQGQLYLYLYQHTIASLFSCFSDACKTVASDKVFVKHFSTCGCSKSEPEMRGIV